MRLDRFAFALFLAACGGGNKAAAPKAPPPTDPIAKTAGPECKVVAEHTVTVILAGQPDQQQPMSTMIRTRCDSDGWTDEVRSCFGTVQSEGEAEGCVGMLTMPQRKAFTDERAKLGTGVAAETAPPPPTTKARTTRGATKKEPKGGAADPCQGGE